MIHQIRKRTEPKDIVYSLHLYFSGLSLRNASKAISRFVQRSHSAIRDWIQSTNLKDYFIEEPKSQNLSSMKLKSKLAPNHLAMDSHRT